MPNVQLAFVNSAQAAALRDALSRTGPWRVECVQTPDPSQACVMVMDEESLSRLALPLPHPERIVLITRGRTEDLSQAWDAGIVSVVSAEDPPGTLLLAIMAAALRVPKPHLEVDLSDISPSRPVSAAPISPDAPLVGAKRCKTQ
jgi:hypothetical protein